MGRTLPILFNTEMVRAILAGRKTVTRRATKGIVPFDNDGKYWNILRKGEWTGPVIKEVMIRQKAPYQPGDILYVRETWGDYRECQDGGCGYYMYRADYPDTETTYQYNGITCDLPRWHPSIHMPKEAARIWLKVTDVRVERLQNITDEGAMREGAEPLNPFDYGVDQWPNKENFIKIWNSTVKKSDIDLYGWDANPWVWVIEFEQCGKPEPCILEGIEPAVADGEYCLGYGKSEDDDEPCEMCKKCRRYELAGE